MRCDAKTVAITEEKHRLRFALGPLGWLDPVAHPMASPQRAQEADRAVSGVRSVVLAHDRLDGFGRFVGVVEGNVADEMVQHMGFDDTVEHVAANEAEIAVDGCGSAACKAPRLGLVVGQRRVGVLQVRDCHCKQCISVASVGAGREGLPSQ